ncbi:uncharacterized protein [Coffea arabica]|uniref:Uncharacterized protein isoform X2 n=1 Tax=Coffea arabica TaxID=13443 RepID=A0A6P6VKL6_COFAR|nr:uncharacterized protein LOC113724280 [Coffea arabica]
MYTPSQKFSASSSSHLFPEEEIGIGCVFLCVKMAEKERRKFRALDLYICQLKIQIFGVFTVFRWGISCAFRPLKSAAKGRRKLMEMLVEHSDLWTSEFWEMGI